MNTCLLLLQQHAGLDNMYMGVPHYHALPSLHSSLLLTPSSRRPPGMLEFSQPPGSSTAAAAGASKPAAAAADADSSSGLLLVERGDVSVIARHPGFRLVAAMNPATDAGKRDLPPQLRSRFTEFWVGEPSSAEDLCQLVGGYLAGAGPSPPVDQVVSFYVDAKAHAVSVWVWGGVTGGGCWALW